MTWERLAEIKESNPVEVVEYAKYQQIDDEPAFKWWVNFILKKRDMIISAVNKRHHKKTHKFGICIPCNALEALSIDNENDNTLWFDVMAKKMRNVWVAFCIMKSGQIEPFGYQLLR